MTIYKVGGVSVEMTTEEAIQLLQDQDVIHNKQTLLRFIREGKIIAYKRSNKFGYRIDRNSLQEFIATSKQAECVKEETLFAKLQRENEYLRRQVSQLQHEQKTPTSHIAAENVRLVEKILDLEEEKDELLKMLKEQQGELPARNR